MPWNDQIYAVTLQRSFCFRLAAASLSQLVFGRDYGADVRVPPLHNPRATRIGAVYLFNEIFPLVMGQSERLQCHLLTGPILEEK